MKGIVTVNGTPVEVDELPCSLFDFLQSRQWLPKSIVVERNGEAIAPSEFAQQTIQAGDRLEIVQITAGG